MLFFFSGLLWVAPRRKRSPRSWSSSVFSLLGHSCSEKRRASRVVNLVHKVTCGYSGSQNDNHVLWGTTCDVGHKCTVQEEKAIYHRHNKSSNGSVGGMIPRFSETWICLRTLSGELDLSDLGEQFKLAQNSTSLTESLSFGTIQPFGITLWNLSPSPNKVLHRRCHWIPAPRLWNALKIVLWAQTFFGPFPPFPPASNTPAPHTARNDFKVNSSKACRQSPLRKSTKLQRPKTISNLCRFIQANPSEISNTVCSLCHEKDIFLCLWNTFLSSLKIKSDKSVKRSVCRYLHCRNLSAEDVNDECLA